VRRVAVLRPDRASQDRELFELIFRNAPDIISIIDRARGQLLVNDAAERLLGHNLHRLEDNAGMVHPEDLPRVRAELPPRPDGFGGPVRYRAQTSRGDWRWLESTSSDLQDMQPVGGILVFTRDVTAEVRAGERLAVSRARVFALVAGFHAGILVQDEEGGVVIANAALMEMFSLDGEPGGIEGAEAMDVMHSLAGAFTTPERFLHAARESVAARTAGVTRWPLLSGTTVEIEAIPINGGAGSDMGYMWAFRDVTDHVAAEDHRRRMEEMERDARAALEKQNARLHELDRIRAQMIATVSHEFRTPLTPIASHVELLLDPSGDPLSADQRESLDAIDRNVARLRRLVDDLLIVRRVEQGLLDIRPASVDIASLVTTQAAQFAPYAKRVGVDLSCRVSPGPPALADADRLGTVIDNLIANALKFTPGGGRAKVTAEPRGDRWEIRVADTGPGIPQAELAHIFEPFFRSARALHEGLPGSGLGLAVSRALVEGHGGTISAESSEGHGSTFTVVLPTGGPA
jgi:PAS domain S-box-containing protein